ncbi:MAG: hypothetical protein JXA00_00750 [Candidatus Thermoplasmatota archaeon]|nr:hypothetical protein [Candidatus Thermoplasmatota archaeon]
MFVRTQKRVVCISTMLVLATFVGLQTTVSAAGDPPVAEAGGPYVGSECMPVLFDASGSFDPESDPLQYRWDFGDGFTEWGMGSYYEIIWLDDYMGIVTLEVTDGTSSSTDTALLTVENVPPEFLEIEGPLDPVGVGEEILLSVTFFDGLQDPRGWIASLDTYTVTIDWGDGTVSVFSLGPDDFIISNDYMYIIVNATHIYEETGVYDVTIVILDDDGGEIIGSWTVVVDGEEPFVNMGPGGVIDEGSVFLSDGFLADNESSAYTATVDYGDGSGTFPLPLGPGNTFVLEHLYCEDGEYTILVVIYNEGMEMESGTAVVLVNNVAPTIESVSGLPETPIALADPIMLSGVFSDPGCLDTHVAAIDWGDGNITESAVLFGTYLFAGDHIYGGAGVYQITVTVTDDDGGSDSLTVEFYVVVYDPSCGFVTGGGWIMAEEGSYPADPSMSGRANFGFVSKYKKGQTVPTGNTEFQFQVASLNFHSHVYEWLIIAGPKAMFKGTGTINGEGTYGFMLTGIDGQINGGGGVDRFRIKIWDKDNGDLIVFDNNIGLPDGGDPSTALAGGQITIHKG